MLMSPGTLTAGVILQRHAMSAGKPSCQAIRWWVRTNPCILHTRVRRLLIAPMIEVLGRGQRVCDTK